MFKTNKLRSFLENFLRLNELQILLVIGYSVEPSYEASYETSQMFCFEDTLTYEKPRIKAQLSRKMRLDSFNHNYHTYSTINLHRKVQLDRNIRLQYSLVGMQILPAFQLRS